MNCAYCGAPTTRGSGRTEPPYCCAGCRLRDQLPVDAEGNFPVNAELVRVLSVGLLGFNQLLCWGLVTLAMRETKWGLAQHAARAEVTLAVITWGCLAWLQWRARPYTGKDYVLTVVALLLIIAGAGQGFPPNGALLAAGVIVLAIWNFRGVGRKRRAALPERDV